MKHIYKIVSLLILMSFNTLAAPVGTEFNYQGQLNVDGSPANGIYDFKMEIWDALTSGTNQPAQIYEDVTVSNGLFSVNMDFGDAPFDGRAWFLKIQVRDGASTGGFQQLSPRQPINTVPYAIDSAFAESGGGQWSVISGGLGYTNDVKIGNTGTTTTSMLTVDSNTSQSPVRFKINGGTKLIINSNGGTSLGANATPPANGLRVIGDTQLNGELKQDLSKNGSIKAGLVVTCSTASTVDRSFNGVNSTAFSIDNGVALGAGSCAIIFPFDLTNRFYVAMVQRQNDARIASCSVSGTSTLFCNTVDTNGVNVASVLHILVY